jgi:predicted dehydrogenase
MGRSAERRGDGGGVRRRRCAIVGTGARAEVFVSALTGEFAERHALVALCDANETRMRVHNAALERRGLARLPMYGSGEFARMLAERDVETVVVCTVDCVHDEYICAALAAGCDVITEKPMTIDAERCRRILAAEAAARGSVTVAFNYRYNPIHERLREVIAAGAIGEVGSVHFEWLLDTRHGADYFRRWHREKAVSGGLLVHKATHHFDLVNWWIGSSPELVFALGRLFFYGAENGARRGLARDYERAHGAAAAVGDPFALQLEHSQRLTALYLDAEHEDGYVRDRNVFGSGIDIEDDMALLVRYRSGAVMSYHLSAYSPWEGYRIMLNGSRGRLELEVTEAAHVDPAATTTTTTPHGGGADGGPEARLLWRPLWQRPRAIALPRAAGPHGGGDQRMLAALFGPPADDPLQRRSTHHDGALSLLTGLAANESLRTGRPVRVADLLDRS